MTENDAKIESLTQENDRLKNDKKREIALDEKLISDLKKRCHDFEGENAELQRKNQKLVKRVSQLEGDVKSLRTSLWLGKDDYTAPIISRLVSHLYHGYLILYRKTEFEFLFWYRKKKSKVEMLLFKL